MTPLYSGEQETMSVAHEIAEQITAGWWDVPAIETREECVEALAQLVSAALCEAEAFKTLSAQARGSYEAGRRNRDEEDAKRRHMWADFCHREAGRRIGFDLGTDRGTRKGDWR
jgi:hypothetical protein